MTIRAAAGHRDITPPVGTDLAGWCFGPSTGVADRLFARVLVLDEGPGVLVIVTLDLIGLGTEYADRLRDGVAARMNTSRERVLVSCSHTHSGPGAMPLRRWGSVDPAYVERVVAEATDLVVETATRLEPATIAAGDEIVGGICDNRRGDHGNIVDERLLVLSVIGGDGEPLAILYNYGCHPVAAHGDRNLISADFPGYAAASIAARFPRAEAMFTLGAAGDVNPVRFHELALARAYGGKIADAAVAIIEGAAVAPSPRLDTASVAVRLPVAPLPAPEWLRDERDRWAREADRLRESGGPHSKIEDAIIKSDWAGEALAVAEAGSAANHLDMEVTAVRIGPLVLVAMPGEPFAEIGLNVWRASPFPLTAVVGLANGSLCYLPTADAYRRGGYETDFSAKVYGLYHLTDQTQEIIERAAAGLVAELAGRAASLSN